MSVLKIKDENGNWVGIPSIKGETGASGDAGQHAHRHAKGGTDEITPESIGAATAVEVESVHDIAQNASIVAADAYVRAEAAQSSADTATDIANSAVTTANSAATTANEAKIIAESKATAYKYGTTDIVAGSASADVTGTLHFVYE